MYSLVKETDEILKKHISPIVFEDMSEDPCKLAQNMLHTMHKYNGVGLAAPQIGILLPVFVMGINDTNYICFNPKIITYSNQKITLKEGCLSFPGLYINIIRSKEIVVEYQNDKGKECETKLNSWFSRIFQHEHDHLQGVTFLHRASKLGLKLANSKRRRYNEHS